MRTQIYFYLIIKFLMIILALNWGLADILELLESVAEYHTAKHSIKRIVNVSAYSECG